jgi:hypothetical protein
MVWHRFFALLFFGILATASAAPDGSFVIDDFSGEVSALGTRWQAFTDRVMGGRSDISAVIGETDEGAVLQMSGTVTTENNGGFIQVRLPMAEAGSFDASEYTGVFLTLRGRGERFYVWLRTARTNRPWLHYSAELTVDDQWSRVELPFVRFEGERRLQGTTVDVEALRSVAVVAAEGNFNAALQLLEIGFY